MAVQPNSIDWMKDTVYRVGEYGPEGFYTQSQLNNNMSGNDANAIYQATHYQDFSNSGPEAERNRYRVENGYKYYNGNKEASPVWGDQAYVTGAGATFEPWYDDAIPAGWGSPGGIPDNLINQAATYASILNAMYGSAANRAEDEARLRNNGTIPNL